MRPTGEGGGPGWPLSGWQGRGSLGPHLRPPSSSSSCPPASSQPLSSAPRAFAAPSHLLLGRPVRCRLGVVTPLECMGLRWHWGGGAFGRGSRIRPAPGQEKKKIGLLPSGRSRPSGGGAPHDGLARQLSKENRSAVGVPGATSEEQMKTSKRLSLLRASQTADLGPPLSGYLRVLVKNRDPPHESEVLGHRTQVSVVCQVSQVILDASRTTGDLDQRTPVVWGW